MALEEAQIENSEVVQMLPGQGIEQIFSCLGAEHITNPASEM